MCVLESLYVRQLRTVSLVVQLNCNTGDDTHLDHFHSQQLRIFLIISKPPLCCRSTSMTSSFSFTLFRLSRTSSSCVQPGGRPVLGQQQAAKYGCTCSITWRQTPASGQVWLSATSMPATVLSCPFSSTRPRWPTSHCRRRRNCCPIGCCATGARSPTPETRPPGPDRQLSAGISVCLLGLATLTPVDGWSWTWRCVHMHRWGPGTMCVTSGTSWASTSGAVLGCTGDLQVVLGFFYLLLLSVTF